MKINRWQMGATVAASALAGGLAAEALNSWNQQNEYEEHAQRRTEITHEEIIESGYMDGFTLTNPVTAAERYDADIESGAAEVTIDLGDCALGGVDVVLVRGLGDEDYVDDIVSYTVAARGPAGTSDSLLFATRGDLFAALTPKGEARVDEDSVCSYIFEEIDAVILPGPGM